MDLLLAKIWYFFYFGGIVCVLPFVNLLYRAAGLSDAQIGIIAAIKPWVSAPSSFLWSGLSDRFSLHKAVLLFTFVSSTLVRSSLLAAHTFAAFIVIAVTGEFLAAPCGVMADAYVVAASKRDTDYGKARLWGAVAWGGLSTAAGWLVSSWGMAAGFGCYVLLSVPCVACAWHMDFGKLEQQQEKQQEGQPLGKTGAASCKGDSLGGADTLERACQQQQQQQQWGVQLEGCSSSAADDVELQRLLSDQSDQAGAAPAADSSNTTRLLQQPAGVQGPQQQQQHSSVSAAADQQQSRLEQRQGSGGLQDVMVTVHSSAGDQDQERNQIVTGSKEAATAAAAAAAAADDDDDYAEPSVQQQQQQQQQQQPPVQQRFWQQMRLLLTAPILIFFSQAIIMGFGIGVIGEYLFLFIQELGGSETLMGLTLTVTCLAEIPVFHYQGALLRRVSVQALLHVVLLAYVLRLGLYAALPSLSASAWGVLPIELLHGICFGLAWGVGTVNSKRLAPAGLAATTQGIFQGLYFGVGQGLGALIGGLLKQQYGSRAMFALCSGICLVGWALCTLAEQVVALWGRDAAAGKAADSDGSGQGWLHRLRSQVGSWFGGVSRRGGSTADVGSSTALAWRLRQQQQQYAELKSKHSGPDLSGQWLQQ